MSLLQLKWQIQSPTFTPNKTGANYYRSERISLL